MKSDFAHEWTQTSCVFSMPSLSRRLSVLTILISLVVLSACVSTPTTAPVTSKQQDINKIVQNNTQNTNLLQGVPQTYTYSATQGAVVLNVNASVQLPQTTKIPVTTVQPTCFTQEKTNEIINTFIPGKQLYQPIGVGSDMPKSYFENMFMLEQALQLPGAQGNKEITTQYYAANVFASLNYARNKMGLSAMPQLIANAPETVPRVPTTEQLLTVNESDIGKSKGYHGQHLSVAAGSGKGYDMTLNIDAFTDPLECDVSFANHDITSVYNYSDQTGNARGISMSLAQAKTLAQNTLQAVGATDLQLTDAQLGTLIPLTSSQNPNTMDQAYGLWFTRHVTGVPTTLDLTDPTPQNAASYSYERAFMLINDSGVIEFSWSSPMQNVGTISSNAKIISFNAAMNAFKEQFFIHYAQNDTSKEKITYAINRITLGLMRVQDKNQTNTYTMVPVWDFFGSTNPPPSNHDLFYTPSMESLLTVNAIDGSIIDRKLGY